MKLRNNISIFKRATAWFLLSLVVSLLVNNVAYLHTHVLSNNQTITHAHPYNKDKDSAPIKTHTHKKFEYSVIHSLTTFLAASCIIFIAINACKKISFYREQKSVTVSVSIHYLLRGPPALV